MFGFWFVKLISFYQFSIILIHFYWLFLVDSVLVFPALIFCILWKPVIWLLLGFKWHVGTWCGIWVWEISKQITVLHMCIFACFYVCDYISLCLCVCVFVCLCVYIYVYIYIYIYIHIYIHVNIYLYICIYVYIYTYIYTCYIYTCKYLFPFCLTFALLLCSSFTSFLEYVSRYFFHGIY